MLYVRIIGYFLRPPMHLEKEWYFLGDHYRLELSPVVSPEPNLDTFISYAVSQVKSQHYPTPILNLIRLTRKEEEATPKR